MTKKTPESFDFLDDPALKDVPAAAPLKARGLPFLRGEKTFASVERHLQRLPLWTPFGRHASRAVRDPHAPRYGDFYERGVAAGIDLTLLFFLLQRPFAVMGQKMFESIDPNALLRARESQQISVALRYLSESGALQVWGVNSALQTLILLGVIFMVQWQFRTTPGKWLLGLKIVDARTLQTPSAWRYAVRLLGYLLAGLPLMIGFFWMSFHPKRRGWHDYLAGTVVIQTRPEGWLKRGVLKGWARLRAALARR